MENPGQRAEVALRAALRKVRREFLGPSISTGYSPRFTQCRRFCFCSVNVDMPPELHVKARPHMYEGHVEEAGDDCMALVGV